MEKLILIVDDDNVSIMLAQQLLQLAGFKTIEAINGFDAVEMALRYLPDLIIMDILLPVMDGIQTTKLLKSNIKTKDIPVIALTAHAMQGDREKILKAGCNGYISKPISTTNFIHSIKKYLSG